MKTTRRIRACTLVSVAAACVVGCTPLAPNSTPTTSAAQPTTSAAPSSEAVASNGYSFGYGTYYVATRRVVPKNWGNAKAWYGNAQRDGFQVGDTPQPGAIAWTESGPYGQVAIVEGISADNTQVTISEMNGQDSWNKVTIRTAPATEFKYIY